MKSFISIAVVLGSATCILAWDTPVNLGEIINTPSNEWYPVLPEDGSFMLFVSDRPEGLGGSDIYITYREGTEWVIPENLGTNVNTPYDESAPFLAENDTRLYFLSIDPAGVGQGDIWYCDINAGIPGTKTNMGSPINSTSNDCCPVMSHNGNRFYICSDRPGGAGSIDIWISDRVGDDWGEPFNAGSAVNTPGSDCPRWISDSDQELVIVSTGPGGYGSADLYTVTASGDTLAGRTNMGPVINSAYMELGPGFLNNGGMVGGTIYFGSARPGGSGGRDIWCSEDTGALEPLTWAGIKTIFTSLFPAQNSSSAEYLSEESDEWRSKLQPQQP